MIKFRCEHCAQKIGVPDNLAGHHVKCPRCKQRVLVRPPEATDPATKPAPPRTTRAPGTSVKAPKSREPDAPEPTRILRGQTLDLEDKPAVPPADETAEEAPASARTPQASLLSLAGITASTPIGKEAAIRAARAGGQDETTGIALSDRGPNWPGLAAALVAFVAGVMIAVSVPTSLSMAVAGAAALIGLAGVVVALSSGRWEYWSAVIGATLGLVALASAYAVGASREAAAVAERIRSGDGRVIDPTHEAAHHPKAAAAAEEKPVAIVPRRARIAVDSVKIGPPELRPDAHFPDRQPRLLIYLTINNIGDQPIQYLSWGPGGRTGNLSSSSGVQLTPVPYPIGELLNHPQRVTISPHSSEHDVLVYNPLRPMPPFLSLDLPSDNIGSTGNLHILIPAAIVEVK